MMQSKNWSRVLLAGPVATATSIAIMAGAALWLPRGAEGIDHLLLPLVLFPAIWTLLFFHACLDRKLVRAYAIQGALLLVNTALIAPQFI